MEFAKYKRIYEPRVSSATTVVLPNPLGDFFQRAPVETTSEQSSEVPQESTASSFRWTSHGATETPYSSTGISQETSPSSAQGSSQYTSEKAKAAVQWSLSKVGKPYVWGAKGEKDKFDCSGLIQAAWKAQEVSVPGSTAEWKQGKKTKVADDQGQPGDVIILNTNGPSKGHAMLITENLGEGKYKVVEAKDKKHGVIESTYTVGNNLHGIYRAKKGIKLIKKHKYGQLN